jgi:HemK-related putative methylase
MQDTRQEIYHPAEDSYLLSRLVAARARGTVLDMGTGSGIQAENAAGKAERVIAVDINRLAVEELKRRLPLNGNIEVRHSDLFSNVPEQFDVIAFNPPYLPADKRVKDLALDGGKKGHELIERFMEKAPEHLKDGGEILLLFSSQTGKEKIDQIIERSLMEHEELGMQQIFFEQLYVYAIRKKGIRIMLENEGVREISFLAKGHRGHIFKGLRNGKKVAIKIPNPKSKAVGRIAHEAEMLAKVNKEGIGPLLVLPGRDFLMYEYVDGFTIGQLLKDKAAGIDDIFKEVMRQMETLDSMGINKQEMTNPHKHILVDSAGKVTLIDFERARHSERPKNVSQFKEYIRKKGIQL